MTSGTLIRVLLKVVPLVALKEWLSFPTGLADIVEALLSILPLHSCHALVQVGVGAQIASKLHHHVQAFLELGNGLLRLDSSILFLIDDGL